MDNVSFNMVFTLSGLKGSKENKYLYFVIIFIVYLLIVFLNLTVIVTVIRERALHEPMYIFLCNLCFNGLWGTAGFYPKYLYDLLNDIRHVPYNDCLVQVLIIYIYPLGEMSTLLIMAYDRFVAICKPLDYHRIITTQTIGRLIICSWTYAIIPSFIGLMLTVRLRICGSYIDKPYCENWLIVKMSCGQTTANNVYGFFVIMSLVVQGLCIVYSYMKLINACRKSKENRNKFMQTCAPHLLSLINFTMAILFDTMFSRYESRDFPRSLRNFMQLEFLLIPPLFNPIIYGLKLAGIRKRVFRQNKDLKLKIHCLKAKR